MTPERRQHLLSASRLGRLVSTGSELPPDQSPPPALFASPPEGRKGDLDPEGHWRNISGNDVHITKDGEIDAGGHPSLRKVLEEKAGLKAKADKSAKAATPPGPMEFDPLDDADIPPELEKRTRQWLSNLSGQDQEAVRAYTSDQDFLQMNNALRGAGETTKEHAKTAERLVGVLDQFPPWDSPRVSYRGLNGEDEKKLAALVASFEVAHAAGGVVTMSGFQSATLDPVMAARFAHEEVGCVLEIRSRRGVYVDPISHNQGEFEVVHNHGSRFRVVGVRQATYNAARPRVMRTFTLEEA